MIVLMFLCLSRVKRMKDGRENQSALRDSMEEGGSWGKMKKDRREEEETGRMEKDRRDVGL